MAANLFPAFIKLEGRACLVVGAGPVGAQKIAPLLQSGARVTVVAPAAEPEVERLAATRTIRWVRRRFAPADLRGVFLVIAATSTPAVNRAVFVAARRRGILCNSVDDPPNCDFYFPAIVRRGQLQIAISTAGESPALAQRIRQELEAALPDSVAGQVREIGALRRRILSTQAASEERKQLLRLLARHGLIRTREEGAKQGRNQ